MSKKEELKIWFEKKQELAKRKTLEAVYWCKDHKEGIAVFGPVFVSGVIELLKISTKKQTVSEEKALKDRYIYDDRNRHYYEMRRKPKSSEWIQIDQRKQNGEPLGWILNDMKLLK